MFIIVTLNNINEKEHLIFDICSHGNKDYLICFYSGHP